MTTHSKSAFVNAGEGQFRCFTEVPLKFPPGEIVATSKILNTLSYADLVTALKRHLTGDWGLLPKELWLKNERSLHEAAPLVSLHKDSQGVTFWIITEGDRSSTAVFTSPQSKNLNQTA